MFCEYVSIWFLQYHFTLNLNKKHNFGVVQGVKDKMKSNLIKDNDIVKVKIVGNEVVLHNVNTCNTKATIKRIGNGKHINVRTGEIVTETKQVKRGDSLYSLH